MACRFLNKLDDLVDIEGLGQVFECAALVGGDRMIEIGMGGHDDDRHRRMRIVEPVHKSDAVHARHAHIGKQHVRLGVFDSLQHVLGALEAARLHVRLPQGFFEYPAN